MYNPNLLNIVSLTNVANPTNTTATDVFSLPDGVSFTTSETTFSNVNGDPYKLFVYGDIYSSNVNSLCPLVFTAGKKQSMWITEEGQVGIGLSNPSATLHVGGNVLINSGATVHGTTAFTGDVVFDGDVTFKGNVHVAGRLFINGREI